MLFEPGHLLVVRLFLFYVIGKASTCFINVINTLGSHLYLPRLAALQIHILIDTQLAVWLEAMPIMHIFMAWQADRPPPSDTIIQSKHQTSSQLWCGFLKKGIFGAPFTLFLVPDIAATWYWLISCVLSMVEGGFCSSSADMVVLEINQEQPGLCRGSCGENSNNNQGWGLGQGVWVRGLLLDHLRHLSEDISPAIRRSWRGGKGRQWGKCCSGEGFVSAHKAFFSQRGCWDLLGSPPR